MVVALAMSTMVGAFATGGLTITSPEEGDVVIGSVVLAAIWPDAEDVDDIDRAIRGEEVATDECRPERDEYNVRYPDVKGNVLNNADDPTDYDWDGTEFSATVELPVGGYCFVISDEWALHLTGGAQVRTVRSRGHSGFQSGRVCTSTGLSRGVWGCVRQRATPVRWRAHSDEPYARDFVFFAVAEEELTKDSCKDGGWEELGYRNQGQCVSYFASDGKSAK